MTDESISPAPPRQLNEGGFLLFAWQTYDALGGWNDFIGRYPTIAAAQQCFDELHSADPVHEQPDEACIVLGDEIVTAWEHDWQQHCDRWIPR